MPASKLAETVSENECQAHLEAQDRINASIDNRLEKIDRSINGVAGDTSRKGLAGGFLTMNHKLDSCNEKLDKLTEAMIQFATNERVDRIEKKVNTAIKESKRTQWGKIMLASITTAGASLTLSAAAYGLMAKLEDKPKTPVVRVENPAKNNPPSRPDW